MAMTQVKKIVKKNQLKQVRIAVLGSGFGAIHTVLELEKLRKNLGKEVKIHVTLFSNVDYFWLVTMAHEVATGNLMPDDVKQPLRSLPTQMFDDFIQCEINSINFDEMAVNYKLLETLPENQTLRSQKRDTFDHIVSSLGSQVNYFGVEGASKYSLPVKTLPDVIKIKNQILQSFEDAERLTDVEEITKNLSFIIVGGGATGVEVAGELADLINNDLTKRFPMVAKYSSITIIHGGKQIGIPGQEWMTVELEQMLREKLCVNVRCDSFVSKVVEDGVFIGEDFIPGHTIIWSGGVQGNTVDLISQVEIDKDKAGRVKVDRTLVSDVNKNIFIIGDQAEVLDSEGNPYPMRAQFAVRQGQLVAENIIRDLTNQPRVGFNYQDKGVIVSLGNGSALAYVFGKRIKGKMAYWLYKVVYIPQIIGIRAKVKTVIDWILNLFTPRDLSKL